MGSVVRPPPTYLKKFPTYINLTKEINIVSIVTFSKHGVSTLFRSPFLVNHGELRTPGSPVFQIVPKKSVLKNY